MLTMKHPRRLFILIALSAILLAVSAGNPSCLAQTSSDFSLLKVSNDRHTPEYKHYVTRSSNEVQFVFSALFLFYKSFISSQDMPSCKFHPSCSEYALLTIKRHGPVIGLLDAFDRLSRCNNSSKNELPIDPVRDKYIDFPQ